MSPTTAPNFSELSEYEEGCPDMYDAVAKYESGDKVSYSITPGRTVVYVCKVSTLYMQLIISVLVYVCV